MNENKLNINWYPRAHGENQKANFRGFKIN